MNKKLEEKLAMLAFGDLSPEETMGLERELSRDPEAGLILRQYRDMRTGLKALHEIPEHQLSTERLRHAVLNQGLKPKARPQLGWLWMPTVAAAFAFGIMFMRDGHQQLPLGSFADGSTIANPSGPPVAMNEALGDPFLSATASGQVLSVADMQPAPNATFAMNRMGRHSRNDRHVVDDLKAQVAMEFDNLMQVNTDPQPKVMLTSARGAKLADAPAASSIVMIDSARDKNTGAQKATEVDSAGDVIVGG